MKAKPWWFAFLLGNHIGGRWTVACQMPNLYSGKTTPFCKHLIPLLCRHGLLRRYIPPWGFPQDRVSRRAWARWSQSSRRGANHSRPAAAPVSTQKS
jgi:hypothetical protein